MCFAIKHIAQTQLMQFSYSDGFFRRQLILTTKDKPADRTDDPFLVEKMCAELEGILLWCLEGLHRLVQNDFRFTVSERAAANVDICTLSHPSYSNMLEIAPTDHMDYMPFIDETRWAAFLDEQAESLRKSIAMGRDG